MLLQRQLGDGFIVVKVSTSICRLLLATPHGLMRTEPALPRLRSSRTRMQDSSSRRWRGQVQLSKSIGKELMVPLQLIVCYQPQ